MRWRMSASLPASIGVPDTAQRCTARTSRTALPAAYDVGAFCTSSRTTRQKVRYLSGDGRASESASLARSPRPARRSRLLSKKRSMWTSSFISTSYVASTTSASASRSTSRATAAASPAAGHPAKLTTFKPGACRASSSFHCPSMTGVQQIRVAPHLRASEPSGRCACSGACGFCTCGRRSSQRWLATSAAHITVLPVPCSSPRMPPWMPSRARSRPTIHWSACSW
mmetsp:Transcript_25743/g.85799  ORF Transcript_25743/g.85799 Transcript_25743/m.85799 type:complete len:226 (+) Transcript_25743:644-1321(+)